MNSFEIRCFRSTLRPSRPLKSSDFREFSKPDSSVSTTIQKRRLKSFVCLWHYSAKLRPRVFKVTRLETPRECMKWTFRDLVKSDLSSILKPVKWKKEVWDSKWFSIISDAEKDRCQWNAIIRDLQEAGQWAVTA